MRTYKTRPARHQDIVHCLCLSPLSKEKFLSYGSSMLNAQILIQNTLCAQRKALSVLSFSEGTPTAN